MKDKIENAMLAIIQARDFCGNENEAFRSWQHENGKLTDHQKNQVWDAVEQEWKIAQLEANVKNALTDAERLQAFKDVENQ